MHSTRENKAFGPQNPDDNENDEMAGVTQAKPWFTESGVSQPQRRGRREEAGGGNRKSHDCCAPELSLQTPKPEKFKDVNNQARPRSTNSNLWVRICSSGVGLPCQGAGAKRFGMSLETRETKRFWRDIPGFGQDIPGMPEKSENKKFVFNFLGCHKGGFKRWGLKQIQANLRRKALFLRFLDFPGALRTLRKRAQKAEKGRKRPKNTDFQEGRPDTPSKPICYTPICGTPKFWPLNNGL